MLFIVVNMELLFMQSRTVSFADVGLNWFLFVEGGVWSWEWLYLRGCQNWFTDYTKYWSFIETRRQDDKVKQKTKQSAKKEEKNTY